MVKCLIWLFWTYLTLKLIQLVFGGRLAPGEGARTLRRRLLRGEPILFAVAAALALPTALLSSGYLHRGYSRSLERAAGCYGRLYALDRAPALRARFDNFEVYQVVQGTEAGAAIAGKALGLEPGRVASLLAEKKRFYAGRYAVLAREGSQARAEASAAIERCLREPPLDI